MDDGRALGVTALALVTALLITFGITATAVAKPAPDTVALRTLVRQTSKLPARAAPRAQRNHLERLARNAKRVAKLKPCKAVSGLSRFRRVLARVKVHGASSRNRAAAAALAALGPTSLEASRALLTNRSTRKCGGGAPAAAGESPRFDLLSSDTNGFTVRVQMPELRFVPRVAAGKTWSQLVVSNATVTGAEGSPGIPSIGDSFGVPEGASVSVAPSSVESYELDGVDVFPSQPEPVDVEDFPDFTAPPYGDLGFAFDKAAYASKSPVPAAAADASLLGTARDVAIGAFQIPAAQYVAASGKLKVITSIDLHVSFIGGSHSFSDELGSPWEQAQRRTASSLLNGSVVGRSPNFAGTKCGEEMLVITNPETRAAADELASARNLAGIRTVVVETGAGAGQIGVTAEDIRTYIRSRSSPLLDCIHPSYVVLLGDNGLVPTFYSPLFTHPGQIPSDLPYSMRDDADYLPDLAVGRILGADANEVGVAVSKIVGYEQGPPSSAEFLNHATVAAYFQDTDGDADPNPDGQEARSFIQTADTIARGLEASAISVDRVYADDPDIGDDPDIDPKRYYDGTPLPTSERKPDFKWNGTGNDIRNDWLAGRFLIVHRDHGAPAGWGTPSFTYSDISGLDNGTLLPVVLSIDCSAGGYDAFRASFATRVLIKPGGGGAGIFAATRESPSFPNSELALGFADALVPTVLPHEGPTVRERVGDALVDGKLRLAAQAPPSSNSSTVDEMYLFHYFGDPSMQMWGAGNAAVLSDPGSIFARFLQSVVDNVPYEVNVHLPPGLTGQTISLLRNGEVIGKAIVDGDSVDIPADFGDSSPKPGELQVALDADGSAPVDVPVSDVPKTATTLTQICPASPVHNSNVSAMTTTGTLSPALAGQTISVTYTRPNGTTFTDNVTTDPNGTWSDTVGNPSPTGNWTIQSSYAGDATYAASSSSACTVSVQP
jgi:Peptidase family C25/Propeptide_C25